MITVVTLGRSASTWYCDKLAKDTGHENLNEVFLTQQSGYKFFLNNRNFNKENKTIVKLLAYQQLVIMRSYPNIFKKVIKNSSRVIFLIRRDFLSQLKSRFSGGYAKIVLGKGPFDEFDEPIIIPKDYIDVYWPRRVREAEEELLYLLELYNSIEQKELVFTEDITTDSSRLRRPFVYETDLEVPYYLQKIIEKFI
jgi:hypothetical protein